jgi:hypothetical protein
MDPGFVEPLLFKPVFMKKGGCLLNFYKMLWSILGVVLSILLVSYLLSTILPQKYFFISFAVLLGLLAIREINEKELTEETIKETIVYSKIQGEFTLLQLGSGQVREAERSPCRGAKHLKAGIKPGLFYLKIVC